MDYNFKNKVDAIAFAKLVNEGEKSEYCEPWQVDDNWGIIKDKVTDKYYTQFTPPMTPPTLSTYRVAIPEYWEMLFPNDRFIVGGFDIPLERTTDNVLCVDVAYLEWKAFRTELQNPENSVLARHMGAVMVYLDKRHENKDYV
jgi:hypothetical protein